MSLWLGSAVQLLLSEWAHDLGIESGKERTSERKS